MKIPIDPRAAARSGVRPWIALPITSAVLLNLLAGCGPGRTDVPDVQDSGSPDVTMADTRTDSGTPDVVDATADLGNDTGNPPEAAVDTGMTDSGSTDAGTPDVPGTDVVDDTTAPDVPMRLEPGMFANPLVMLRQLVGAVTHLHVDELRYRATDHRLFQCSYTFGVINATDPRNMTYLAQNLKHAVAGDMRTPGCKHLAPDGNFVYTTHSGNLNNPTFLSGWDVTPNAMGAVTPVQLPVLQEPGVSYEGIDVANGYIYVGLHDNGLGVYQRDPVTNVISRVGNVTGFANAWGVRAVGNTVFVADGSGGLATVDVTDPTNPRILGEVPVGGEATDLAVNGNTVYVAAGAAGLAIVDVSDLANPTVLSRTVVPGMGVRVDYAAGRVVVAAWNDGRIYDVSDPMAPRFLAAVRLTTPVQYPDIERESATDRVLGVATAGDDFFIGGFHLVYSYHLFADRVAPNLRVPEEAALIDFGQVAVGQSKTIPLELVNQGTAPLTIYSIWSSNPAFTVAQDQLRLQPGETGTLTLTYTATATTREVGYINLYSDDPAQPLRKPFVVGNNPGLGVGQPLPDTEATLMDGTTWSSSQTLGNVTLLSYFATF